MVLLGGLGVKNTSDVLKLALLLFLDKNTFYLHSIKQCNPR